MSPCTTTGQFRSLQWSSCQIQCIVSAPTACRQGWGCWCPYMQRDLKDISNTIKHKNRLIPPSTKKIISFISMKVSYLPRCTLTHWGQVTHICISKLTIIGSDNGLSPGRRQAIIWTNDGILLIRTLLTNFSENLSDLHSFSFNKMHLKMSSAKWRLFRLGLNELTWTDREKQITRKYKQVTETS